MRYVLLLVGGLMAVVGVLPGSFITGQSFWAITGAVLLAVGGVLIFAGLGMGGRR